MATPPREPREPVPHGLDDDRVQEVEEFLATDPVAIRFFLFFDALRLRNVETTQAARTAHLITSGEKPGEMSPIGIEHS